MTEFPLVAAKTAPIDLAERHDARFTGFFGDRDPDNEVKMLYAKLEREASGGATLGELEAHIDREGRQLTDVQREEAWLYALALRKRQERRLLGLAREEEHGYGYADDTGAG